MTKLERFRRLSRHLVITFPLVVPAMVAGYVWEAVVSCFKTGRVFYLEDEKLAIDAWVPASKPDSNT